MAFFHGAKIIHNHITQNHLLNNGAVTVEIANGAGIGSQYLMENHWVVVEHNAIDHNSSASSLQEASGAGISVCYNTRIAHNDISSNVCEGSGTSSAIAAAFACYTDLEEPSFQSWQSP